MIRSIYIFVFLLSPLSICAQPEDARIETIDGTKFYMHEVEAGNTLYGIHKLYNIDLESIIDHNPGAEEGLQIGQVIKIPVPGLTETPSTDTVKVKGVKHTVEKGETVFGISRKYGVKAKEILEANPEAKSGIQPGQVLIIPAEPGERIATDDPVRIEEEQIPDTAMVRQEVTLQDSIIEHVVKRRETLYSLSRRYMVTIEELKVANDGLIGGLKKGDTVLIPLKRVTMKDVLVKKIRPVDDTLRDTIPAVIFKDVYEVALFMPLFLDENERLEQNRPPSKEREIYRPTSISVDFYRGVQLAVDSLTKAGISVRLHVFDTEKDTAKVNSILGSKQMSDIDLIIGPFYTSSIKPVAAWAKEHKVHMVVPVPQSNKMLFKNPYISKVVPSAASRVQGMARYIARTHHDHNIIIVDSQIEGDQYLYKLFRETLDTALTEYPDRKGMVQESFLERYKIADLTSKVDGEDTNVVVAPSTEISFVSNLMTRMNRLANSHTHYATEFVVFGMEEWSKFNSIDIIYKHELNLHLACGTYIDYDDLRTSKVLRSFRNDFGTDPGAFGFMGFDVAFTYIAALSQFGTGLPYKVGSIESEGVHTRFDLQQVENDSGFENKSVYILKHEDFDLIRKN